MFQFFKVLGLLVCWRVASWLRFDLSISSDDCDYCLIGAWRDLAVTGVSGGSAVIYHYKSRFNLCRVVVSAVAWRCFNRVSGDGYYLLTDDILSAGAVAVTYNR